MSAGRSASIQVSARGSASRYGRVSKPAARFSTRSHPWAMESSTRSSISFVRVTADHPVAAARGVAAAIARPRSPASRVRERIAEQRVRARRSHARGRRRPSARCRRRVEIDRLGAIGHAASAGGYDSVMALACPCRQPPCSSSSPSSSTNFDGERVQIVRLAAGDPVVVDDHLAIDDVGAGLPQVALDRLPRGQRPPHLQLGGEQQLRAVADRRERPPGRIEGAHELHEAIVGAQIVGRMTARDQQALVAVDVGLVDRQIDDDRLASLLAPSACHRPSRR